MGWMDYPWGGRDWACEGPLMRRLSRAAERMNA